MPTFPFIYQPNFNYSVNLVFDPEKGCQYFYSGFIMKLEFFFKVIITGGLHR